MDRMISYFVALAVAAALALGWDRHPPIGYTAPWWLGRLHVELPASLAEQRDVAVENARRAKAAETLAEQRLSLAVAKVSAQDASILAMAADRNAKLAEATAQVALAKQGEARAQARAAKVNSYRTAPNASVCQDLLAADEVVRAAIQ